MDVIIFSMGQKANYSLRWPAVVPRVGLIAIALFSFHAISSLVFSVIDLAPSSPKWGLALTLWGFLAVAGAAAGLGSLRSLGKNAQRLTGLASGAASVAILGFYTLGQLTGQQAQWAIVGAVLGCLVGGGLGITQRVGFWRVAIAITSGLCAYGTAFGLGTWALAAVTVQRWELVLLMGLGTGLYLWLTRRALGVVWETI
ncbi:hypothetical protein [Leptothoe sp. PORK10 BA2]|uniref:hypothetical protein n=1 Tax=Leptothoe sp. PORK10 BA2 TaxID=3110254 RepID=UPI002B20A308|nr:hypothetical protein [Leptothoe sp. PORK10 BA2]MEA5464707.1 hypothetical protein [Leptothoe sp. PORK10 BA2]